MATNDPQFFEHLCREVAFALIATDPSLNICFWNLAAERMFGARADSMHGQPAVRVFPEEVRADAQRLLENALREGAADDLEVALRDSQGRTMLLTAVISPIFAADGTRLGASVCVRDITRRRELSRQLSRAHRMASLGAMAGGVAHHFNSMLGGAMTTLDFILSRLPPGERFRKEIERVDEAIGRAARISGQLMTFAEGDHESGLATDLARLVREFADHAQQEARPGLTVNARIEPIPPTLVEAHRMTAVLDSLKRNAIEAMPTGGELTIGLRVEGGEAVVTIGDSGCGIPEDKLDAIFEPFYTTKGELGGGAGKNTGLGLSVVHSFISDMGGRIEAASTPAVGTRFDVRLPLGGPPLDREPAGDSAEPP